MLGPVRNRRLDPIGGSSACSQPRHRHNYDSHDSSVGTCRVGRFLLHKTSSSLTFATPSCRRQPATLGPWKTRVITIQQRVAKSSLCWLPPSMGGHHRSPPATTRNGPSDGFQCCVRLIQNLLVWIQALGRDRGADTTPDTAVQEDPGWWIRP